MKDFKPIYKSSPLIGFEALSTGEGNIKVCIGKVLKGELLVDSLDVNFFDKHWEQVRSFNKEDAQDFVNQMQKLIDSME